MSSLKLFLVALGILSCQKIYAAYASPTTDAGCSSRSANAFYKVTTGSSAAINELTYCAIVNNSSGSDLFVPTCTSAEYVAFLNAAQAGSISGVTLSCCQASGNSGGQISQSITTSGSSTLTLPYGCTTATITAWGAGGGGGSKETNGTAKDGGSGGYAVATVTGLTARVALNINIATGGTCSVTSPATAVAGGAGEFNGGTGGRSNACGAGSAGGGTGTGGGAGAKVGNGCLGGVGKWGGGGGGGGDTSNIKGSGGGGATAVYQVAATYLVIAGGGGGSGASDQGTAGAGGAACGGAGGNSATGDTGGGGGGGACECRTSNASALSTANCTTTTAGTGKTPAGSPPTISARLAGSGGDKSTVNSACNANSTGNQGAVTISYP